MHELAHFGRILIPDVSEDIGHTIAHFLYTGAYETIDSPLDQDILPSVREYQRSIEVYHIALRYQIEGLRVLAREHLEYFGNGMETVERLRPIRRAFSKPSQHETWLPNHVKDILRRSFMSSKSKFSPDIMRLCENGDAFSMVIMRSMIEVLSAQVERLEGPSQSFAYSTLRLPLFHYKKMEEKPEKLPEEGVSSGGNESDATYDSMVPDSKLPQLRTPS